MQVSVVNNNCSVTAILLCAGNSTRYGRNRNKNFEILNGKSILLYSLEAFLKNDYIDDIIIAVKDSEFEVVDDIVKQVKLNKNVKLVLGGNSRLESVYNCITNTNSKFVIIHDAARPMIRQEYINKCIENVLFYPGVTVGVKSKDTIKISNKDNIVKTTTNRDNTWIIQTPQCFDRDILLKVHEKNRFKNITDDCMLLEKNKYPVKILEGGYTNIKVTTYEDIKILNEFLCLK